MFITIEKKRLNDRKGYLCPFFIFLFLSFFFMFNTLCFNIFHIVLCVGSFNFFTCKLLYLKKIMFKQTLKLKSTNVLSTFKRDKNIEVSNRIGIIGVPFDKGQTKNGVSYGPDAIRNGQLLDRLHAISSSIDVRDYGNIQYTSKELHGRLADNMKKLRDFAYCTMALSKQVQTIIRDNRVCVTLGGDHSIAVGSIDGHINVKKDIAVVWVDAHADINTNSTSPTGNIHGMPVGLVLRELEEYWPYIPGMDWQKPQLSSKNIAYIALRDVDAYEHLILEKFNITAYGMREVELYGIKEIVKMALKRIDPDCQKSLHISFDIDALDVLEAPSTGTAVRGGLSLREGIYVMEEIYNTGRLGAVDLVEVNPKIGEPNDMIKTVNAAVHLLQAACGHNRRGNFPSTENIPKLFN